MLLEFSIRKDQKFPYANRAYVCWDQKRAYTLKTTFGHYTFYRLMQDILSELSRPMQKINNKAGTNNTIMSVLLKECKVPQLYLYIFVEADLYARLPLGSSLSNGQSNLVTFLKKT